MTPSKKKPTISDYPELIIPKDENSYVLVHGFIDFSYIQTVRCVCKYLYEYNDRVPKPILSELLDRAWWRRTHQDNLEKLAFSGIRSSDRIIALDSMHRQGCIAIVVGRNGGVYNRRTRFKLSVDRCKNATRFY